MVGEESPTNKNDDIFSRNKAYSTIFLLFSEIRPFYKNGHGKMEKKKWAMFIDGSCYMRKS